MGALARSLLKECPDCEGRGLIVCEGDCPRPTDPEIPCNRCGGRGAVLKQETRWSVEQGKELPVLYSGDGGITVKALEYWRKRRRSLGDLQRVVVVQERLEADCFTFVEGTEAVMILEGLSVGYCGEGPHGLGRVLKEAGMWYEVEDVLGRTSNAQCERHVFRVGEAARHG